MKTAILIIIVVAVVAILSSLIWRLSSRRSELPCPAWLRWMVEMDNPFTKTNRAAVIISYLGLQPSMKVLDAGCGPGRLTVPAAQAVGPQGSVLALDLQAGMLQRAREKAQTAGLNNVQFMQAGLGEGKLEPGQFDRALLVTVLGEIPDQERALKEIFAALKPGGILSVTEVVFDPHFQNRETIIRVGKAAGFREKAFFGRRLAFTLHLEKPTG